MSAEMKEVKYHKLLVDNAVCKRRFHLVYEQGVPNQAHTSVECPHCGVTVFESDNFPPVMISREENLIKSPDGSERIITKCGFSFR